MSNREINKRVFLEEELRDGYLVSKKMKSVWECQIDLLLHFMEVCEKYKLKYWADAGTLLGAVRHSGFIPWDDDIDMVMFRDDYDKLVEVAPKEFTHPYFFQTIHTDRYYTRRHAQLRNSETAAISSKTSKQNQGVFIDIFVLDSVYSSPYLLQKQVKRIKKVKMILKVTSKVEAVFPQFISSSLLLKEKIYRKYEKILRFFPICDCDYVSLLSASDKIKIKNKAFYDETIYVDFEYVKIPIPARYDEILTIDFGDYMIPIQAPTMHGTLHFDTERSYLEILNPKQ